MSILLINGIMLLMGMMLMMVKMMTMIHNDDNDDDVEDVGKDWLVGVDINEDDYCNVDEG